MHSLPNRVHAIISEFAAGNLLRGGMTLLGNSLISMLNSPVEGQPTLKVRKDAPCQAVVVDEAGDIVSLFTLWEIQNLDKAGAISFIELRITLTRIRENIPEGACRVTIAQSWLAHRKFDLARYRELERKAPLNQTRTRTLIPAAEAFWWTAAEQMTELAFEDSGVMPTEEGLYRWLQQLPTYAFPSWFEGAGLQRLTEEVATYIRRHTERTLTQVQVLPVAVRMIPNVLLANLLQQVWVHLQTYMQEVGIHCSSPVGQTLVPVKVSGDNLTCHEKLISILQDSSEQPTRLADANIRAELFWGSRSQSWSITVSVTLSPCNGSLPIERSWGNGSRYEISPATLEDIDAHLEWVKSYDVSPERWKDLAAMADRMLERIIP